MHLPSYYEFLNPVPIIAGATAIETIPRLLNERGARRVMVVSDPGVSRAGLLDTATGLLEKTLEIAVVADDVPPDSDLTKVAELAGAYRQAQCQAMIAVGGGSVMDTAKAVNILVSEAGEETDLCLFSGHGKLKHPLKPLIAIPTTAGTGSEVTAIAVIKDHAAHRKLAFSSQFLLPDAAILDPRMTVTLPSHITAATAMDALSHAMEAYTCLGKNPLSDTHATTAVRLISENLLPVIKQPDHIEGRLALAMAATLAGTAFANSMVGNVHTLGHAVGGVCGVPHGVCMAILLPYGLAYNLPKIALDLGELLLPLAGPQVYASTPEYAHPYKVIESVHRLNQALFDATGGRHGRCFKELAATDGKPWVPRESLPAIAAAAMSDPSQIYNPEAMDRADLLAILTCAWEGAALIKPPLPPL
jgi:alcohol dehydrogenase